MTTWFAVLYALVTFGAVVRLTRFVVLDDLGHWLIKAPLQHWAWVRAVKADKTWDEEDTDTMPTGVRAAHGLGCPFCVSTWLGIGATALALAATLNTTTQTAWFIVAAGLTMSYLTGHIIDRLDLKES